MGRLLILWMVSLMFLAGCGGSTSRSVNNQPSPPSGSNPTPNPTPTITAISPNIALAGVAAFTLTINGTNFVAGLSINGTNVSGSVVNFGGTALTNWVLSATQLTAAIPAASIASAGTASVTVTNLAPGGGISNALNFTITSGPNPVPTIDSLSPSCAPVGVSAFTLSVFGSNFVASSVVQWNGSDRPTPFVSSSEIDARIPAGDIAATGTATVTVFNPAPGGGSSNTLTFTMATGGMFPQSVAVDPTGKFAYVANEGCDLDSWVGNVSMYTINPTTGALTSIGPPVAADFGAHSVTVDPFGKFAYVANQGGAGGETVGSVSTYTINATTGTLSSVGTMAAGTSPSSIAIDPSGRFTYVVNSGSNNVSMYSIDAATGALTLIGTIGT